MRERRRSWEIIVQSSFVPVVILISRLHLFKVACQNKVTRNQPSVTNLTRQPFVDYFAFESA